MIPDLGAAAVAALGAILAAVATPDEVKQAAGAAILSLLHRLLKWCDAGFVQDIGRIKEGRIQSIEGDAQLKQAQIAKTIIEAAKLANEAGLLKPSGDAEQKAEQLLHAIKQLSLVYGGEIAIDADALRRFLDRAPQKIAVSESIDTLAVSESVTVKLSREGAPASPVAIEGTAASGLPPLQSTGIASVSNEPPSAAERAEPESKS